MSSSSNIKYKRTSDQPNSAVDLKFLSAWFCPYAQRAWIALEFHPITYEWLEALVILSNDRGGEYYKDPLLTHLHPNALVPTLAHPTDARNKNKCVIESNVCVEFIDDFALTTKGSKVSLFPGNVWDRVVAKNKIDHLNRNVASLFYLILNRKRSEKDRVEAHATFVNAMATFGNEAKGPFYYGDTLSAVDLAAFPWIQRLCCLNHYNEAHLRVPLEQLKELEQANLWYHHMINHPAVKPTLCSDEAVIPVYERYAIGDATFKINAAVLAGKSAHDVK